MLFIAATVILRVLKLEYSDDAHDCQMHSPASQVANSAAVVMCIRRFVWRLFTNVFLAIRCLWPYIIVFELFLAFVVLNGGIVLGLYIMRDLPCDKQNHVAGLHVPQLYYFFGFTAAFGLFWLNIPEAVYTMPSATISSMRSFSGFAVLSAIPLAMWETIRRFTVEHPFLLADNRHYTFYIWKNVFRRHAMARYALIPAYMFSAWAVIRRLYGAASPFPKSHHHEYEFRLTRTWTAMKQSVLWITAFCVCLIATLVPSPLVEFRYYVIPYLLVRLHVPMANRWMLALEAVLYAAVNAATLYLFLERGFVWPGTPGTQRFMW
eukprot:jgi/Hompol1/2816/HPOL_003032-RA